MDAYTSLTPARLAEWVGDLAQSQWRGKPVRVAIDGPRCAHPSALAVAVADGLRVRGETAVVVEASTFWRNASLRLELGRTDADAYYERWLDVEALNREVLDRVVDGTYLPALRDPETNRAVRRPYEAVDARAALIVAGQLLLGQGLSFDLTIHLATSPTTRARRTAAADAWTLPAFDRYEDEVDPAEIADVVVSANDPARPAVRAGSAGSAPAD